MRNQKREKKVVNQRRSPQRIVRWVGRFLGWSASIVAALLVLIAVIALLVYVNRVRILNESLAIVAAPYRISVGEIDFSDFGTVQIDSLELSPKNSVSETPLALIDEAIITYDFDELRRTRQLKTVTLKGAHVVLDEENLAALEASPRDEESQETTEESSAGFDLAVLAYFTDSFAATGGTFLVETAKLPRIAGQWGFKSGPLAFDESDMTLDPLRLDLREIEVAESRIAAIRIASRVNRDFTQIDIVESTIDSPELVITPDLIPESQIESTSAPDEATSETDLRIVVRNPLIRDATIAVRDFVGLSSIYLETELDWGEIRFTSGLWQNAEPLSLTVSEISLGEGTAQIASADQLTIKSASLHDLVFDYSLDEITLSGLDAILTDETIAPFLIRPETAAEPIHFEIKKATLDRASFLMRNFTAGGTAAPEVETRIDGELRDLSFGPDGLSADAEQQIQLGLTRVRAPGVSAEIDPLLSFEQAEATLNWDDFSRINLVKTLTIRGPQITFTDEALGAWMSPPEVSTAAGPIDRPVYKVGQLEVTGGRLRADSSFAEHVVPKINSSFTIETLNPETTPFLYRFSLDDVELRNHPRSYEFVGPPAPATLFPDDSPAAITPLAEENVLRIEEVSVDFTAAQLQRTRKLDKLKIKGATLTVGEGLKEIAGGNNSTEPEAIGEGEPAPPEQEIPEIELPTWLISEIEITESRVLFDSLIPQIEGLEFDISTKLTEVPLSLDGLLAQDEMQKIEIAGIEIKDPYNSFITVAEMPTIFVEFSLAGLARQEVEKIDLLGPSLYVGQGLFWWIEYQRNFREQNEGTKIQLDREKVALEVPAPDAASDEPTWVIKQVDATAGKIVVAPTGVPLGVVPFPFNATTNMSEGNIELKLEIPEEEFVYQFPKYEVDLHGLTGNAEFNVPMENFDNNLVQTFALDRVVWKDYEASDLYITVTFDAEGVYGKFGGNAYDGYAEGQFNFYLDGENQWDAWVSGTDFDTDSLTQVIAPENFQMEGRVSLRIISEGQQKQLGETTGEIQMTTPGSFDITKLDEILANLPPGWSNLQRSLTTVGLETVKRFDYDRGAGSLSFEGQEGEFELRFTGPYGSRELNLHVHDERNVVSTSP